MTFPFLDDFLRIYRTSAYLVIVTLRSCYNENGGGAPASIKCGGDDLEPKEKTASTLNTIVRIIILLVLAVALLYVIVNSEDLKTSRLMAFITGKRFDREQITDFSFAPDPANAFAMYQDGIAILSSTGLSVLDGSGDERLLVPAKYSKPVIKAEGKYLVGYDVGGTRWIYIDDYKILKNELSESTILNAEINAKGWAVIVTQRIGSKATCTVYNNALERVYEWISPERYITCTDLSDDCKSAAVGGLRQENAKIVSTVILLRLDSETPYAQVDIEDVVILDMKYLSDGSLAVLTENSVMVIDSNGKLRGKFEFDSELLAEYDFDGADFLLLRLQKSDSAEISDVHLLDFDANREQTVSVSNIISMDAKEKYIGILTSDKVIVYNNNLEKEFESEIPAGSKKLLIREDGAALVLSTVEATIIH